MQGTEASPHLLPVRKAIVRLSREGTLSRERKASVDIYFSVVPQDSCVKAVTCSEAAFGNGVSEEIRLNEHRGMEAGFSRISVFRSILPSAS